jgi:lipopolysaccharide transport system ATP-binding protein
MSSEAVMVAEGVGKYFRYYRSNFDRAVEWMTADRVRRHEGRWALSDINFRIARGESVGIVGHNGAGKSTLLKLLTGTMQPTVGRVTIDGWVAALLELGMGFHPDFTGRQNVDIGGRLLGLSEREIMGQLDWIIAFSELEPYIDQPLRTYSSGMQMRLAFALATALRPDVLIIDEALAVGDIRFQQRCFERIDTFRTAGTTLLFVSHDLGAVYRLCHRVLVFERGRILFDGPPKEGIELYYSSMLRVTTGAQAAAVSATPDGHAECELPAIDSHADALPTRPGDIVTSSCRLLHARWYDERGEPAHLLMHKTTVSLALTIRFAETVDDPHVGFKIHDRTGMVIFETNTYCMRRPIGCVQAGLLRVVFTFPCRLVWGEYTLTVGVAEHGRGLGDFERVLLYATHVSGFTVARNTDDIVWAGLVNLEPEAAIELQPDA